MREIEIALPANFDGGAIELAIDQTLDETGLTVSLRSTLKKFRGCVHWHVKHGCEAGTLEITLWPPERRAWFTIQDGRRAAWIDAKLKLVSEQLQRKIES
jgi:hypothetical protein